MGNKIEILDLLPLRSLSNLWQLELQENQIKSIDISPLVACRNLKHLEMDKKTQILINKEINLNNLPEGIKKYESHLKSIIKVQKLDKFL